MRQSMRDYCAKCNGELFVTVNKKFPELNHVCCIECLWNAPLNVWREYCEVTQ